MEDEVVFALHALYDVWDPWAKSTLGQSTREQDDAVRGTDGEITAVLVYLRGESTHNSQLVARERLWGEGIYGEGRFGEEWIWMGRSCSDRRYAQRHAWFEARVAGHVVEKVIEAGVEWLRGQSGGVASTR